MAKKYTNLVLDMLADGVKTPQGIVEMCLAHMGEDDVRAMCSANGLLDEADEHCRTTSIADNAHAISAADPALA